MRADLNLSYRQFLAFELAQGFLCLMATENLLEVTSFSTEQIVPIMNVPDAVLGLANYRSEIIGIIDLPSLLDLPSLCAQSEQQTFNSIVVRYEDKIGGFCVNSIGQLLQIDNQSIKRTTMKNLPRKFIKCVQGSYHPIKGRDMLVIDTAKLFSTLEAISSIEL